MTKFKIQTRFNYQSSIFKKQFLNIGVWILFGLWTLNFGFFVPTVLAQTQTPDSAFNPNLLITNQAFEDNGTFGSAQAIEDFLVQKNSVLANTTPQFLLKLKEPDTTTKVGLEDPEPNLGRQRTAAELIYDAAQKSGLNPQVILVTLQKEQSLILGTFNSDSDLQTALDRALGFGCPDSGGCGSIFLGFYNQLFGAFDAQGNRYLGAAASLMKSFSTQINGVQVGRGPEVDANNTTDGADVRTSRTGDTIVLDNSLGGFLGVTPQQSVELGNAATAALYRYTPHVFNGNYNFWKYYTLWFKYPNGTVIQKIGDNALYIIDNGSKRTFSSFVASQRKIDTSTIVGVSQTEFDSYDTEPPLTPNEGTLLKGDADPTVYIIQDTKKHAISGPIFAQYKYSFKNVITLPQAEVDSYATGSFLAPKDGTLITGTTDHTVYLVSAGLKEPISYSVFVARKLSFKNVLTLTDTEVAGIGSGPFLLPPDQVQIQPAGSTAVYWYNNGMMRFVSAFVYKQRGVGNFPIVTLGADEFNAIIIGSPFPPKDGTVIKGDQSSAIYVMQNGVKRMYTAASYKKARYPKATVLPQAEVDSYDTGDVLQ